MKVTASQKNQLMKIAVKYGITQIFLFGSQVKWTARPTSDIDFGIESKNRLSREQYAKLTSDLAHLFYISSTRVDLTELSYADPLLLQRSYFDGELLYGDPKRFQERKMYALKRLMDHKKFLNLQDQYIQKKLYARD